jgi:hypothetical protein
MTRPLSVLRTFAVFEPLLGVTVPDRHVDSFGGRRTDTLAGRTRKVIIIGQIWASPPAERNAAAIVEHLLRSSTVGLIASADYADREVILDRLPVGLARESQQESIRRAEVALGGGEMTVMQYVSLALAPTIPLVGVNDAARLTEAHAARADRNKVAHLASILDHLQAHLAGLLKCGVFSTDAVMADRIVRLTEGSVAFLPRLLRFASTRGLQLDEYPALLDMQRELEAEQSDRWQLRTENVAMTKAILECLLGGAVESRALDRLFDVCMRRILHSQGEKDHLLHHSRPLYACAQIALSWLVEARADDLERNDTRHRESHRRVLDLASILGFNDRRYSLYRSVAAAQASAVSVGEYKGQLRWLEKDLMERVDRSVADTKLHVVGRYLRDLQRLLAEGQDSDDARRVVTNPPSAARVAAELQILGASVEPEEQTAARSFDEEVLPPALIFYQSAVNQRRSITDGLVQAMSTYDAEAAILLCGGFHPTHIADELAVRGQGACSIIIPKLDDKEMGHRVTDLDPRELRRMARPPLDIHVHHLGGIRQWARELRKSVGGGGEGASVPDAEQDLYGSHDNRGWVAERWQSAQINRLEAALKSVEGEVFHECRVCYRQAPLERASVICTQGCTPDVVLECRRCEGYVCGWCAGRLPFPVYPGHERVEAAASPSGVALLVCNVHALPLGSDTGRRIICGTLPGHLQAD